MRFIAIFFALIYCLMQRQIPKITFIIIIYFLIYAYSTHLNNGNLFNLFNYSMSIISLVVWLEIVLKNNPLRGLQSLNIVFSLLVYLNLVFIIVFPDGYMQVSTNRGEYVNRYFLGVYNQFAATLIPAIIINIVYVYLRYGKVKLQTVFLLIISSLMFVFFWSATSIVGLLLIVLFLILINNSTFKKFINAKIMIPIIVGMYFIIVIFNKVNIFGFFVENVLKKDVTLSTRTIIWEAAIDMIEKSPLFGYGYLGDGGKYIVFSIINHKDAHNTGLQYMLQHGIIGFIPLVIIFLIFLKKLAENKRNNINIFILYSFFVATTMMLAEVYAFRFILIILFLGIYSPYIIKEQEKILDKGLK